MTAVGTQPRDIDTRVRARERELFAAFGLAPTQRWVNLTSPRATVRVLEFGADCDGPPIVLLHGIASVTAIAAPLLAQLRQRRILAVDWPGHGLSGPIRLRAGESLRQHAHWVLTSLCTDLELTRVDLVGHSLGGQFGLYFALAAPARVRRLVLLGAPGAGFAGVRPVPAMRLLAVPGVGQAILKAPIPISAYRHNNEAMLGTGVLDRYPPAMVEVGYLASRRRSFASSVASFFRALITPTRVRPHVPVPIRELGNLVVPTLLVWGEHDVFLSPDAAADSISAIPHATFTRINGGHAPWLDDPDRCGRDINAFLDHA